MSDSKMTGMLTCPDCKVIHPLGGCAEYLREKRLASAMTDTLRDRLGALVRELTARLEEAESERNLNETEHDWPAMNHNRGEIEAYKVALRLAAQPAPAVMGEARHVGWIAGHCSDPMNCPVCKAEGDMPTRARKSK